METISVPLQNCSYPIWVDNGVINSLEKLFLPMNRGQIWVLFSQKNVYDIISKKIYSHLKSNGFKIEVIILDDGEKAKTFASIEDIFNNLSSFDLKYIGKLETSVLSIIIDPESGLTKPTII